MQVKGQCEIIFKMNIFPNTWYASEDVLYLSIEGNLLWFSEVCSNTFSIKIVSHNCWAVGMP